MGGHLVDSREIGISVTDSTGADAGAKATVSGQTVTFHEVGQYTLHMTVDGNHSGRFTLHYTLLPAANQDGLHLSVDGQPTPSISTYGEKCNGAIVVQSGNAKLPDSAITRAEVTAIANRMLGRSADQNYIDDHQQELTQFTDVSPYYWAYYDIMEAVNEHSSTKQNGVESWSDVKKK